MNDSQPMFMQIMDIIENDIITGVYKTDDLIISTTQISKLYSVNPTTAVKAVSKLTDAGILYKKRGIGMCVAEGAREKITERRREIFLNVTINAVLAEAKTLGISNDELIIKILQAKEQNKQQDNQ
ncbi:MAG: GntR family transcriptional regulator [Oscillospiraceae bacterium]|nr:GntR family transcriptional regulator [Oscillospiraceae bacterium]